MEKIMKNTFRYFAAAVAILLAASCQKALDKTEVEADFEAKGPVPTVSIDLNNYTIVEEDGYAEVKVTYNGVSADMDSLELGVLVSLKDNFLSSTAVAVDADADGTYSVKVPVRPAQTNYVKATVANISGSAYSETLVLDVPAVPWYKMMAKTYSGDAYSYWDEGTCSYPGHTIGVEGVENADGTATVTFTDFDPFAVSNSFPSVITATYDIETRVANIPVDEYGMFDAGLGGIGYYCIPFDNYTDQNTVNYMTVKFSEDFSKMDVQMFGTYNSGWYEIVIPTTYSAN